MFKRYILQKPLIQGDMEQLRFVCDFKVVKKSGRACQEELKWLSVG